MSESQSSERPQPPPASDGEDSGFWRGLVSAGAGWLTKTPAGVLIVQGLLILLVGGLCHMAWVLVYEANAYERSGPPSQVLLVPLRTVLTVLSSLYSAFFWFGMTVIATGLARIIAGRRDG